MYLFAHPNPSFVCPICGTSEDKQVVLIPIEGSNNGTHTYQANAYHVDCIDLFEFEMDDKKLIGQVIENK